MSYDVLSIIEKFFENGKFLILHENGRCSYLLKENVAKISHFNEGNSKGKLEFQFLAGGGAKYLEKDTYSLELDSKNNLICRIL